MCRLLGFAAAGSNTSLNGVLGMQAVRDFRNLSEIHNDGWGSALVTVPSESPYLRDGGAPTPETGTAIYKNTIAARHDPIFDELANTPARGGLWHLRLASSNLPLILENQQPFYANGLSFIHNGDISDDQGRNIITNRAFPVDPSIVQSTGGRSDSAIFFAVILQYIGFGFALDEAVAHITRYSSKHSEAIVSENPAAVRLFQQSVDAACVYANVSTAFTDGAQFGLGAEIGISTQKLHARGPMALRELTSYKYLINGNGQTRA